MKHISVAFIFAPSGYVNFAQIDLVREIVSSLRGEGGIVFLLVLLLVTFHLRIIILGTTHKQMLESKDKEIEKLEERLRNAERREAEWRYMAIGALGAGEVLAEKVSPHD